MREHAAPELHVFVCANRRDAGSPLGTGCAERGDEVYEALKKWVAERGDYARVWVTKTHCLGICPKTGCTIALYSKKEPVGKIISEVSVEDAIDELG